VQGVREPERSGDKGAFAARDAVDVVAVIANGVPEDEPLRGEVALDRVDGGVHVVVVPRKEAVARHQQDGRVQASGPVGLGERPAPVVVATIDDLLSNAVAQRRELCQLVEVRRLVLLEGAQGPIDTDPGEEL
jgi:hypothetical protein